MSFIHNQLSKDHSQSHGDLHACRCFGRLACTSEWIVNATFEDQVISQNLLDWKGNLHPKDGTSARGKWSLDTGDCSWAACTATVQQIHRSCVLRVLACQQVCSGCTSEWHLTYWRLLDKPCTFEDAAIKHAGKHSWYLSSSLLLWHCSQTNWQVKRT